MTRTARRRFCASRRRAAGATSTTSPCWNRWCATLRGLPKPAHRQCRCVGPSPPDLTFFAIGFAMQSILDQQEGAHVAIIMDGNGRWALRRGLPRSAGHEAGIEAMRRIVETAPSLGIGVLTLFAFS